MIRRAPDYITEVQDDIYFRVSPLFTFVELMRTLQRKCVCFETHYEDAYQPLLRRSRNAEVSATKQQLLLLEISILSAASSLFVSFSCSFTLDFKHSEGAAGFSRGRHR